MTTPASLEDGARRARNALETYRRAAMVAQGSTEATLRSLLRDLAWLAAAEGVPFTPLIAEVQAWWLFETARAKERPNTAPAVPDQPTRITRKSPCRATASPAC